MNPEINSDLGTYQLVTVSGSERKTSGSYYTPTPSSRSFSTAPLNPSWKKPKGKRGEEAEQTLLKLKVCDPACGSGHFLVAAAHRLASRLATIRSGEDEPSLGQPAEH